MKKELDATKKELEDCKAECNVLKQKQHLRLSNIQDDDERLDSIPAFHLMQH